MRDLIDSLTESAPDNDQLVKTAKAGVEKYLGLDGLAWVWEKIHDLGNAWQWAAYGDKYAVTVSPAWDRKAGGRMVQVQGLKVMGLSKKVGQYKPWAIAHHSVYVHGGTAVESGVGAGVDMKSATDVATVVRRLGKGDRRGGKPMPKSRMVKALEAGGATGGASSGKAAALIADVLKAQKADRTQAEKELIALLKSDDSGLTDTDKKNLMNGIRVMGQGRDLLDDGLYRLEQVMNDLKSR